MGHKQTGYNREVAPRMRPSERSERQLLFAIRNFLQQPGG